MAKQRKPEASGGKGGKKKQAEGAALTQGAASPAWGASDPVEGGRGMDAVSAHLDRGWDLLQRGDLSGARVSAEHVLELESRSPEGHTLLGAISAARGDAEEALEHYQRAMAIDPTFIDPVLYAVEAYMWPLEEWDKALEMCEHALDLAEEEDEFLDAQLLKAEIELAMGDDEAARRTMSDLPPVDYPDAIYHLRAGRSFLELEDPDEAATHFQKALQRDPKMTDALHGLGACAELRGDREGMVRAFLEVRGRDLAEPAPPWTLGTQRFEELCSHAIDDLPDLLRERLANVPVIAADYPAEALVRDGLDPRMLGFFGGVPFPDKSNVGGAPHLDCIYLFQRNIERIARVASEIEIEVQKTLVHEAGHFFGMSEEDLEEIGLG